MQDRRSPAHLLIALVTLVVILALGAAASAQGLPWIVRPGASVTVSYYSDNAFGIDSITLDLSSLGLPDLPMTRGFFTFTATFTIPENTAPGDYVIAMVLWDWTGQHRTESTLRVTRGLLFESLAFNPAGVQPGESTTLKAVVSPGSQAVASATADLSSLGLSAFAPLAKTSDDTWAVTFQVAADISVGHYPVTVTVRGAGGEVFQRSAVLQVEIPEPLRFSFGVAPNPAHAGQEVTAQLFSEDALLLLGTTVDLSALGLSSMPLTFASGMAIAARFTVPEATPPGDYPVSVSVYTGTGTVKATATLTVTIGPLVAASFTRSPIPPGGTTTLTATVEEGASPTAKVTADLSAFGLSALEPLPSTAEPGQYSLPVTVPLATPEGAYTVPVTATDAEGRAHTGKAGLRVERNVPLAVKSVVVEPASARPGDSVTLAMDVEPYTGAQEVVTADLSALGLAGAPLPAQSPSRRALTFTIPETTAPGAYLLAAVVRVDECVSTRYVTTLTVLPPLVRGDVDASGAFTMADVATSLRIAGGLANADAPALAAGDIKGGPDGLSPDGRMTLADAVALARAFGGL